MPPPLQPDRSRQAAPIGGLGVAPPGPGAGAPGAPPDPVGTATGAGPTTSPGDPLAISRATRDDP